MKILIIDDERAYVLGLAAFIKESHPDAEIGVMRFDEADERTDLLDVDYVIIDLSHPKVATPTADEFPGVRVAARLARARGAQRVRPFIVVLTGESEPFRRKEVRRRLHEAGCEYFLHRHEFHDNLDAIISESGPRTGRLELPGRIVHGDVELGPNGRLNEFVDEYPRSAAYWGKAKGQMLTNELAKFNERLHTTKRRTTKRQVGRGFLNMIWKNSARIDPKR